jgi:hypothetical protein
MNGRMHDCDESPEGRIAAVVRSLCIQMEKKRKREPDYADFREVLRPFVQRELLNARIDEARKTAGLMLTARVRELAAELQALKFPDEYDL